MTATVKINKNIKIFQWWNKKFINFLQPFFVNSQSLLVGTQW